MEELDRVTTDSLPRFLLRWYGPPSRPESQVRVPGNVPDPLARWYGFVDQWQLPLTREHRFLSPNLLPCYAGKLVFLEDLAGSRCWAVDTALPDAEVVQGQWGRVAWRGVGMSLSRFLVHAAVHEELHAPAYGVVATLLSQDEYRFVVAGLRLLRDEVWRWPDPRMRYWAGDGLLVYAGAVTTGAGRFPGGTSRTYLAYVAAREPDLLARFAGLDWDWDFHADTTDASG